MKSPIRRLLNLARPEWRLLALGSFFLLVGSATTLAYPQAVRMIMDQALVSKNLEKINTTALWLLVIFGVQGLAVSLRYFIFTFAGERIVNRLRGQLFKAIIYREVAFFDKNRTGELLSRIASDTTVLQNTVSVNVSMVLRNSLMTVGGISLLIYHSTQLSFLILLVVPPVALGTVFFGRKIRKSARASQDALAEANQVAEESLSSIRTVRSFSAEPHEENRYDRALKRALNEARRRMAQIAIFQGVSSFAGFAVISLVLWYGGQLVLSGGMSIGALTSYLLYTVIVAFSLASLGSLWSDFMRAGGAAGRVFELLDSPHEGHDEGYRLEKCRGEIQFSGVHFTYPARPDVHSCRL